MRSFENRNVADCGAPRLSPGFSWRLRLPCAAVGKRSPSCFVLSRGSVPSSSNWPSTIRRCLLARFVPDTCVVHDIIDDSLYEAADLTFIEDEGGLITCGHATDSLKTPWLTPRDLCSTSPSPKGKPNSALHAHIDWRIDPLHYSSNNGRDGLQSKIVRSQRHAFFASRRYSAVRP